MRDHLKFVVEVTIIATCNLPVRNYIKSCLVLWFGGLLESRIITLIIVCINVSCLSLYVDLITVCESYIVRDILYILDARDTFSCNRVSLIINFRAFKKIKTKIKILCLMLAFRFALHCGVDLCDFFFFSMLTSIYFYIMKMVNIVTYHLSVRCGHMSINCGYQRSQIVNINIHKCR